LKKTLDAEDVGLLKHLLDMELREYREEASIDIVLFMGVDGRIFSSFIPPKLDRRQYSLLKMVQGNLAHICAQLRSEDLKLSVQQYKEGMMLISSVGKNAFLASLIAEDVEIDQLESRLSSVIKASAVLKHIIDAKPLKEHELDKYPEDIALELKKLSRLLFKERFSYTKKYKKNNEILSAIKAKIETVAGKGNVDQITKMTFNEMGEQMGTMDSSKWIRYVEIAINSHLRPICGDHVADEALRMWIPEIERKIKSFV
jgi:predicted regulator of Ras-like GTPase activity (Roadblock/LC7/MglB family)